MSKIFLVSFLASLICTSGILNVTEPTRVLDTVSADTNNLNIVIEIAPSPHPTTSLTILPTPTLELELAPILHPSPTSGEFIHIESSPTIKSPPDPSPSFTPIPESSPSLLSIPTPTPITVTGAQLDKWFTQYANEYSVNEELLKKIAACESGYNPQAKFLGYGGLYQYTASSWAATRARMNLEGNADLRFDAEEAIKTAAFQLATSGPSAWPNCTK